MPLSTLQRGERVKLTPEPDPNITEVGKRIVLHACRQIYPEASLNDLVGVVDEDRNLSDTV